MRQFQVSEFVRKNCGFRDKVSTKIVSTFDKVSTQLHCELMLVLSERALAAGAAKSQRYISADYIDLR